jgi:hypothetical protein
MARSLPVMAGEGAGQGGGSARMLDEFHERIGDIGAGVVGDAD